MRKRRGFVWIDETEFGTRAEQFGDLFGVFGRH
jgi:hypothetical protein